MPKNHTFSAPKFKYAHNFNISPNPERFSMHTHNSCEMYYFISGNATYKIEDTVYNLMPGTILLMRNGETHMPEVKGNSAYERICINFSPELFTNFPDFECFKEIFFNRELGTLNLYSPTDFQNKQWRHCLDNIDNETAMENPNFAIILTNFFTLLSCIYNVYLTKKNHNFDRSINISVEMINYINRYFTENISLKEISNHFYLSQSQTNRIFKKATGSSVWEYIVIKRLMLARESILKGTMPAAACAASGFSDYSAFYKAYKARFNHSPKEDLFKEKK